MKDYFFMLSFFILGLLFLGACPQPGDPINLCVEEDDSILLPLQEGDRRNKLKVLIFPFSYEVELNQFSPDFTRGLREKGWKLIDADALSLAPDPIADMQRAMDNEEGESAIPAVVAFYRISPAFLDRWAYLSDGTPWAQILITGELDTKEERHVARRFREVGNAAFAYNPQAFSQSMDARFLCLRLKAHAINMADPFDQMALRIYKTYFKN